MHGDNHLTTGITEQMLAILLYDGKRISRIISIQVTAYHPMHVRIGTGLIFIAYGHLKHRHRIGIHHQ